MLFKVTEAVYINGRGQKLKTYAYRPDKPRCVLFFHHGFGEAFLEWPVNRLKAILHVQSTSRVASSILHMTGGTR